MPIDTAIRDRKRGEPFGSEGMAVPARARTTIPDRPPNSQFQRQRPSIGFTTATVASWRRRRPSFGAVSGRLELPGGRLPHANGIGANPLTDQGPALVAFSSALRVTAPPAFAVSAE